VKVGFEARQRGGSVVEKVDWRKTLKHVYGPSAREVVEIEVPEMRFLMVDGKGDPNSAPAFGAATETLYALSYAAKFAVREREGVDYAVSPIEGLWWSAEPGLFGFEDVQAWWRTASNRDAWEWTLMIMQPEHVTEELLRDLRAGVEERKGLDLAGVRFEPFREGLAAQIMHRGPYAEEWPTIEKVHRFIEEQGGRPRGKHHEIYLKNPSRTAPENLRTIIRQPFFRTEG
jgi:hypothetical protein